MIVSDTFLGGICAADVNNALEKFKGRKLDVYINSPGGDVFEARAISSSLKRLSASGVEITAYIDGLCASAATMIACSCDTVKMADGCMYMIHEVSGFCFGTKADMRRYADLCEKIEGECVNDYVRKTGIDGETVLAMMEAETWLSASEAKEKGFVDEVVGAADEPEDDDREDKPDAKPSEDEDEDGKPKNSVGKLNANRLKLLIASK